MLVAIIFISFLWNYVGEYDFYPIYERDYAKDEEDLQLVLERMSDIAIDEGGEESENDNAPGVIEVPNQSTWSPLIYQHETGKNQSEQYWPENTKVNLKADLGIKYASVFLTRMGYAR